MRDSGEHGRVVLDMQLLPEDVGRQVLHAGQRTQPALEDGDLLGAVHAVDAEHRLDVDRQRAQRMGSAGAVGALAAHAPGGPASSTWRSAWRKSVTTWRSSRA